ncbi:MAG TPA: hypothetical protein VJ249_01585 [Candidatus Bathyarchaeia archaeon]|nr:hypothetical protein [Candidatus Bathyarchaeia archaeon]
MVQDSAGAKTRKAVVEASDEPLLIAVENLKKGMMFTMSQLNSRRVLPEKKLRWLKALTRQVEALVNVVEALHNIGSKSASDVDLATFLSSLEKEFPTQPQTPALGSAASECRTAMRQASMGMSGMSGMRRATSRRY